MRSTYKPDFPFSNFVLENYTTRNAMSCFGTIRLLSDYRARDPISVAWFDQVTLFSEGGEGGGCKVTKPMFSNSAKHKTLLDFLWKHQLHSM